MNTLSEERLVEAIDGALPQTQCTQCGYAGCLAYSKAIVYEGADINRCPPGGDAVVAKLAKLVAGSVVKPVDPECGETKPLHKACIIEEHCIGCTKCIQVCPVDAILGANKWMHTVISDFCTGCELCVLACPVDCIEMKLSPEPWSESDASIARERFHARNARLEDDKILEQKRLEALSESHSSDSKASIMDALNKARERRARK